MNSKNVLKGLAVKDLEATVDFNCKIWVKTITMAAIGAAASLAVSFITKAILKWVRKLTSPKKAIQH